MTDKVLRDNIATYYDDITMPGGYIFNLPNNLKQIDAYYMGKYIGSGKDTDGKALIFENITKPTIDVAEKLVDLDTKNILFLNNNTPGIRYMLYKMQRRFRLWIKKNSLGELLNDCGHNYPKYGHVVIKKGFDKTWRLLKIQNLRLNASYEWIKDMPFIYEIMEMDKRTILGMKWNGDLDYIKSHPDSNFILYECYERNYDEGKKWKRYIKAGVFRKKTSQGIIETIESDYTKGKTDYLASVTLHEDELDDIEDIYREVKFEKVEGRWLGLGFGELLFDEQKQTNTICYLSGKAMLQKAMHLYYTKDDSVAVNADDYEFGQIIQTFDQITPVNMSNNADLSAYNTVGQRVQALVARKTHNTDIAMGETLPSQTPLGLGQLQAQLTMSFFDKKREILGLFVRDLIEKDYYQEFLSQNTKEHYVLFPSSAEEYEIMLQAHLEEFKHQTLTDNYDKTGNILAWDEIEAKAKIEEEKARKAGELSFKIPEKAYKDIEVDIIIEVTGESIDIKTKQSIYQFAMSTLASNPQLMLNATTRELFFRLLENSGENPVTMGLLRESLQPTGQNEPVPAGVGVTNPPANPAPAMSLPGVNTNL